MRENGQRQDSFDLLDFLKQIKKNLIFLILAMILTGSAGFCISKYLIEAQYESAVMMIVNTRQDSSGTVTNDNIQSAQNLVSTYSIIVKSNSVLNEAIQKLDLPMDYEELKQKVYINAVDDTQVMRVAVRDSDPKRAENILKEIVKIAPDRIVDAVEAGSCKVISQAVTGNSPVEPNVIKNTMLAAAIGLVLSVMIVAMVQLFSIKKIIDDDDVQKYIELPVLGVIPEVERS